MERLDDTQLAAWRTFLNAHAAVVRSISRDLATTGHVPLEVYDVLTALDKAEAKRLRIRDLADHVVLSRSGLSRFLDRLEADGLVHRTACPDDRRGALVVLTDEGKTALDDAWPIYARNIRELFTNSLSPDEIRAVSIALDKVHSAAVAHDNSKAEPS